MLSLLYFKSVALVFHGMNYYEIQQNGTHEEVCSNSILFYHRADMYSLTFC